VRLAVIAALGLPLLLGVPAASAQRGTHRDTRLARPTGACRVPHLTGVVVAVARRRLTKAGCRVRLLGASVKRPDIQTIGRQGASPGERRRAVTVWVNQLCSGSADPGPPRGEPFVTPGPTELISGLYLAGGPHRFRSAPRCDSIAGTPGPGTIAVTNPATGETVTITVTRGHLAMIRLPAGTYSVVGTFAGAVRNGQHIRSFPKTVTIPAGRTVRQDAVVNIP
jgi:hypothetical protein